ncbi:hypothetical protein ACGFYF_42450 [Streptomyces lavendulae]|uniref:hypothetical protein n=1 Tax=Streptomyces lavendulae TaxID=1914 RepID=UPI00371B528D
MASVADYGEEEIWSCSWCHAATHVGGAWFEVSRPPYLPVDMRWERAVADGLPVEVSHAFGLFDRTLCGIQGGDGTVLGGTALALGDTLRGHLIWSAFGSK